MIKIKYRYDHAGCDSHQGGVELELELSLLLPE
jgi:hypothetical protein